jgi:hypothetical protein
VEIRPYICRNFGHILLPGWVRRPIAKHVNKGGDHLGKQQELCVDVHFTMLVNLQLKCCDHNLNQKNGAQTIIYNHSHLHLLLKYYGSFLLHTEAVHAIMFSSLPSEKVRTMPTASSGCPLLHPKHPIASHKPPEPLRMLGPCRSTLIAA